MIQKQHRRVLVDTGPLVAILDRSDQYHEQCLETLKTIQPPLLTTWPVLTEVAWLLRGYSKGLQRLYNTVDSGFLTITSLDASVLTKLGAIHAKFQSAALQLADLTLAYLAEQEEHPVVFTLDRRDFMVLQKKSRRPIVLLPDVLD